MSVVVRFSERERYDIQRDAETICYMATTSLGSYFAEVSVEGAASRREMRAKFKIAAIEAIQRGENPGEIDIVAPV